jgi:hypothetical protein
VSWLEARVELPVGPLFCVVNGPTRCGPWSAAAARPELRHPARERACDGASRHTNCATRTPSRCTRGRAPDVIQRQLGHTNLGITSIYLQGIDNAEIIDTVHARRAPMIPSTARCASDVNRQQGSRGFLAACRRLRQRRLVP